MYRQPPTTQVSLILRLNNAADADAWDQFVAIYSPLIWSIAKKLGMSDADASDACQNTLLRLTQVVHQWSPNPEKSNFRGWLFRVARNCMLRQFEREKNREHIAIDREGYSFLDKLSKDADDDGESVFQLEFKRQMFAVVVEKVKHTFKPLYWEAFQLTYLEHRSAKEAADVLGTQVSTIYVARHRVLKRIREEVAELSASKWGIVFPEAE